MEDLKINTNLEVSKLAALEQSKIVNLNDENKQQNASSKAQKTSANSEGEEFQKVPVDKLVEMANQFVKRFSTKITFHYDPEQRKSKILVTEKETGRVIREIPPEQMVDLMNKMEEIAGIIYNGRA